MKKVTINSLLISAFALLSLVGCNLSSSSEESFSHNEQQSSNSISSSNVKSDKAEMIYDFDVDGKGEDAFTFTLDEFDETFRVSA